MYRMYRNYAHLQQIWSLTVNKYKWYGTNNKYGTREKRNNNSGTQSVIMLKVNGQVAIIWTKAVPSKITMLLLIERLGFFPNFNHVVKKHGESKWWKCIFCNEKCHDRKVILDECVQDYRSLFLSFSEKFLLLNNKILLQTRTSLISHFVSYSYFLHTVNILLEK